MTAAAQNLQKGSYGYLYCHMSDRGQWTAYAISRDGYNYEKGVYTTIALHWDNRQRTLTIGARNGAFKGMKETRLITASLNMPEGTEDVLAQVEYDGSETVIRF